MMVKGQPAYYSRYANGIHLYMVPDQVYSVIINGTTRFAPLVNDSDTNPYLEEGEQLIRALAKAYLLEDVIRDPESADRQWALAKKIKSDLIRESAGRSSTNRLRTHL